MGVNARSENFLYLLLHQKGTIQEISKHTYYAWRSVQEILFEMGHSSLVHLPQAKRSRSYYLHPTAQQLFFSKQTNTQAARISWPALFRSLEIIWLHISQQSFQRMSPLEQSTEIKLLMEQEIIKRFVQAGVWEKLPPIPETWGEEYLHAWQNSVLQLLRSVA